MRHVAPPLAGYQLRENGLWLSDNTIADATTVRHGLLPKLPGGTTTFLRADGAFATPSGSTGSALAAEFGRRHWNHQCNMAAGAFENYLIPVAPVALGSTSADSETALPWIRITSGAVSGNVANLATSGSYTGHSRERLTVMGMVMKTGGSIADVRYWFGFTSGTIYGGSDPASLHLAAFRYDTGVDGTVFWRTCTKDGTTMTATATSVAIAADTRSAFRIELDASEVRFYIDDALVNTHTTNLPGNTTNMGWNIGLTTLTGSAKYFRYGRMYGHQVG